MWKPTFEERLVDWVELRNPNPVEPLEAYLLRVNEWWHQTPWSPYYLHWDDVDTWPTPWELLDDNIFCPISRGLGMLYTVALCGHPDIKNAALLDFGTDNLVVISRGLYVLNYSKDNILNITLPAKHALHRLPIASVLQRI